MQLDLDFGRFQRSLASVSASFSWCRVDIVDTNYHANNIGLVYDTQKTRRTQKNALAGFLARVASRPIIWRCRYNCAAERSYTHWLSTWKTQKSHTSHTKFITLKCEAKSKCVFIRGCWLFNYTEQWGKREINTNVSNHSLFCANTHTHTMQCNAIVICSACAFAWNASICS